MRYVIIGLGGVGGTIAAKLHLAGNDVIGVARGEHLRIIQTSGLTFVTPDGTHVLRFPVVAAPAEIGFGAEDVVILATKSQDTAGVARALRPVMPFTTPIIAAQNGVENERLLRRMFPCVYGMFVILPGTHLRPGEVIAQSSPVYGQLDVGRYPGGTDAVSDVVAASLRAADFDARSIPDVLRWKYGKLRLNLANAAEAICGTADWSSELSDRLRAEADAVFAAGGIAHATADEVAARMAGGLTMKPIDGITRGGNSTWQSLARGTGRTEVDFLNGEIDLLGATFGVPTPANATVVRLLDRMAAQHAAAGSMTGAQVLAAIDRYPLEL